MKNMNISKKLLVSFIMVAAMAAIVAIVGIVSLVQISASTNLLNTRADIGVYSAKWEGQIYQQRAVLRGAALYSAMDDQQDALDELDKMSEATNKVVGYIENIEKKISTPETKALYDAANSARAAYSTAREAYAAEVAKENTQEEALRKCMDDFAKTSAAYSEKLEALADYMITQTTEANDDLNSLCASVIVVMIIVGIIAVVISLILSRVMSGLIATPITRIVSWINLTGNEGNLIYPQTEWDYCDELSRQTDEIGVLANSYGKMLKLFMYYQDVLKELASQNLAVDVKVIGENDNIGNALKGTFESLNMAFRSVNNATGEVQSGAVQISDGAQNLAEGSTEQAATVEELSASIQDILLKTKENSEMAKTTANLSNNVMSNATAGTELINDMTQAVMEINQASSEISKVIKVIDDIAFQTNILALNAAVEAARAGEAGKGFAVVADEVRNLASKSAAAAKETNALIENSVKKAEQGSEIAAKTSSAFAEIVSGVTETVSLINSISESSDEQAHAINQINTAIEQVSEVVQRNSATAEQSAASSEELNAQANVLSENVAKFKLR